MFMFINAHIMTGHPIAHCYIIRGGVKSGALGGWGPLGGGAEARPQLSAKKLPLFVVFFHSMQKPSKRVKHNKTY